MTLTTEQVECVKHIEDGHNVVILGQGGTGKSYLVCELEKRLSLAGKRVQITASTGIAASHFQRGCTIHSWAGILDGRYSNAEIVERINMDAQATQRIKDVDLLIIDEISMLSAKQFDQVEHVCRQLRNPSLFFGGIQVVMVGDFYQLPPVANELYQDPGKYAFESEKWQQYITHKLTLSIVMRQTDNKLVHIVNELEKGSPSDSTNAILKRLSRPLPPGDEPTILYATNFEVDWHNSNAIEQLPGERHVFKSTDTGQRKLLNRLPAKQFLALKEKCPVILLKNLSHNLVNGSRGSVLKIDTGVPIIKFGDKVAKLDRECFSVYDPISRNVLAERYQYPIALSYSITVHKSQGLTIPRCEVHCRNIRQPGQLGVAIGRASSFDGLRVVDYNPSNCTKHMGHVYTFSDEAGASFSSDLSCCPKTFAESSSLDVVYTDIVDEFSDDSEFADVELEHIDEMEDVTSIAPTDEAFDDIRVRELLDELIPKYTVTRTQQEMSRCLTSLKTSTKIKHFLNSQFNILSTMIPDTPTDEERIPLQREWQSFYSKYQNHLNSADYLSACGRLFSPNETNHVVCGHIMTALRKRHVLSLESEKETRSNISVGRAEINASAYSKIRYVGGRTVAKLKYRCMNKVRNTLQSGKVISDERIADKIKVDMLQSITMTQSTIMETTKYAESLSDTFRKQNLSCSLTNISDSAFDFFFELERIRLPLYTQFSKHGSSILNYVKESIINYCKLFGKFAVLISTSGFTISPTESGTEDENVSHTLNELTTATAALEQLYTEVVTSYLSVTDNEFRRNLLSELGKKKTMEHRKQILVKTTKQHARMTALPTIDQITTTSTMELSHLKLKSAILENELSLTSFTKKQLILIGSMYNLKLSGLKPAIISALALKIRMSNSMAGTDPESQQGPSSLSTMTVHRPAGTEGKGRSTAKGKGKGKGKGIGKGKRKRKVSDINTSEDIDQDMCAKCREQYYEEDTIPWIGCTNCDRWWHRTCCGLDDDQDWEQFSSLDAEWKCPICDQGQTI